MYYKMAILIALKRAWWFDKSPELNPDKTAVNKSSVISQLIFDIFGGEILKTHKKKSWHFYNRINGVRVDFTNSGSDTIFKNYHFEDIPSSEEEIKDFFEPEQYSPFYIRFIREFEETVGLDKFRFVTL